MLWHITKCKMGKYSRENWSWKDHLHLSVWIHVFLDLPLVGLLVDECVVEEAAAWPYGGKLVCVWRAVRGQEDDRHLVDCGYLLTHEHDLSLSEINQQLTVFSTPYCIYLLRLVSLSHPLLSDQIICLHGFKNKRRTNRRHNCILNIQYQDSYFQLPLIFELLPFIKRLSTFTDVLYLITLFEYFQFILLFHHISDVVLFTPLYSLDSYSWQVKI